MECAYSKEMFGEEGAPGRLSEIRQETFSPKRRVILHRKLRIRSERAKIPLEEITRACRQAGLRVEHVADGEDFGPLRPDSVRYFITAVKQAAGENE